MLEKVKAHDSHSLSLGWPKAVGNDLADRHAGDAAANPAMVQWRADAILFGDPVQLIDANGMVVLDLPHLFATSCWARRRGALVHRRAIFDLIYPPSVAIAWEASCGIFRRPIVSGKKFVHPVTPAVIKWISRVRAGCLAS
jgi:hypothetical protein